MNVYFFFNVPVLHMDYLLNFKTILSYNFLEVIFIPKAVPVHNIYE